MHWYQEYAYGFPTAAGVVVGWVWLWRELHPKPVKPRAMIQLTKHGDTWR